MDGDFVGGQEYKVFTQKNPMSVPSMETQYRIPIVKELPSVGVEHKMRGGLVICQVVCCNNRIYSWQFSRWKEMFWDGFELCDYFTEDKNGE